MTMFPTLEERTRSCLLPVACHGTTARLTLRHEEDCVTWFWAFPDLWPEPRSVTWIYTPVCGDGCGDLWGIDEQGDLLVVECKRRWASTTDAFEDFPGNPTDWTATRLRARWERGVEAELALASMTEPRPEKQTRGILPRSNHREHIARWPELAARIRSQIEDPTYRARIQAALKARQAAGDRLPAFYGLIVANDRRDALTPVGVKAAWDLRARLRSDAAVGLIRAEAVPDDDARVRLIARRQEIPPL